MKIGSFRGRETYVDEENPYWISFSDVMAGLLVIFILAALALILELTETRNKVDASIDQIYKAEQVRRDILSEIKKELEAKNIFVIVSANESTIHIPDDLLTFDTDEYKIPDEAKLRENLKIIGETIYSVIVAQDRWKFLDTIFIEGHTDSRRSYRTMGNWGLSTYRAISVWNYWNDTLPEGWSFADMVNHENEKLFSVSGYGDTRPLIKDQKSEDDYMKNRRIDIRFTVKKPTKAEFEDARTIVGGK